MGGRTGRALLISVVVMALAVLTEAAAFSAPPGTGLEPAGGGSTVVPGPAPVDAGVPSGVAVSGLVPTNEGVLVSFTYLDSGSSPVTSATVTASPGSQTCTIAIAVGTRLDCLVIGLTNGDPYTFRATVSNDAGPSLPSDPSVAAVPLWPAPPSLAWGDRHGRNRVDVHWNPPPPNGGAPVTGYTATASPGGRQCTSTVASCIIAGLAGGTAYTFTVTTHIASATSAPSAASDPVVPYAVADQPGVMRNGIWYFPGLAAVALGDAGDQALAPYDACVLVSNSGCHGTSSIVVVRDGTWSKMREPSGFSPPQVSTIGYGDPGDTPVVGDWTGDGTETPAVVRDGTWFLRNSFTSGVADSSFAYGDPGDVAITGDWNGIGVSMPGVVRNGTWYLRNTLTSGIADVVIAYGDPGDIPLMGDWNGDGVDTPGVFRDGVWYLRNTLSTGVADVVIPYGDPGDLPVVGAWGALS